MFLKVNFGDVAKFYQVNPKDKYAREISGQAYSRWTKPGAAVGGPFSDYWSIKVDGIRGDENVAYFRHAGGKNWNLVGSKLTSTGADRDAVIAMMSKFVKSHGARIIGDDGVPTFFKTEKYNLEPRNEFSWVATPVATAPATPNAISIPIGEKGAAPADKVGYVFIKKSTSVTPIRAGETSRENCRNLGEKADRKYKTFAWFTNRGYNEANGETEQWNDMYEATNGVDEKKYALVVYTKDDVEMFKKRKDLYDLQGTASVLPDLYDSWQCQKDSVSAVTLPQYDPTIGPDSYYPTHSEGWKPVSATTDKTFVKDNYTELMNALINAKYLFVGTLKDLIKNDNDVQKLRVWNAGVLMYYDTSDNKWKNLGIDNGDAIITALNEPPPGASGSSPKIPISASDASLAASGYAGGTYSQFTMYRKNIFEDDGALIRSYYLAYFQTLYA